MIIYCDSDNPFNLPLQNHSPLKSRSFVSDIRLLLDISHLENLQSVCECVFSGFFSSLFFEKLVSGVSCLVKELPQGLVALPLVADFSGGDAAGAGADVGRAVLLTRVVQVAGLGCVQAVVFSGHCRLTYTPGTRTQGQEVELRTGATRKRIIRIKQILFR